MDIRNFLFILSSLLFHPSWPQKAPTCPDTFIKDFNVNVDSQKKAEEIFISYFSEEKGFPKFNPKEVYATPCPTDKKSPAPTCYFYDNWYGQGPNGLGGFLYPNGRLVKKGYCK